MRLARGSDIAILGMCRRTMVVVRNIRRRNELIIGGVVFVGSGITCL